MDIKSVPAITIDFSKVYVQGDWLEIEFKNGEKITACLLGYDKERNELNVMKIIDIESDERDPLDINVNEIYNFYSYED